MDRINNAIISEPVEDKHLIQGSTFRDPNDNNNEYRIVDINDDGTYMVIDIVKNEFIKSKKEFFEPLEYIGSYDLRTGKFRPVGVIPVGGKSRRRRHKTRQTKRRKHRKSKSRRHRR
jgi:hypothetical protein